MIAGGASILGLIAYITIVMNTADVDESKANIRDLIANDPINNGEIVLGFSWDMNPSTKADIGANAISIQSGVCMGITTDSTFGLSASPRNQDINMVLKPTDGLNADGLDISIDYNRTEESGNFYTRGNSFNFGMEKGILCIKYKLTAANGKSFMVDQKTNYEIPMDGQFRNYRFIYNPATGKAEVMVNRATVWTNQSPEQCRLTWKTTENIVIGNGMSGNGKFVPIFDNLIVRKTGTATNSPISLLSFTAEMQDNNIMLNWFTAKETETDFFKIEKSTDTKNYIEVGRVKASGNSVDLKAYALLDTKPNVGVTYYRLGLGNSTAKSIWVPVIAIRVKPEMMSTPSSNTPTSTSSNINSKE
jgi:hypothetical protein